MAGTGHGKPFLTLLYKMMFKKKYPQEKYNIIFEPTKRIMDDLYYLPDIFISQNNHLVLWIEVGKLDFYKAQKVIEFIGEDHFCHVPFYHPVFSLDPVEPESQAIEPPKPGIATGKMYLEKDLRDLEAKTIRDALKEWIEEFF